MYILSPIESLQDRLSLLPDMQKKEEEEKKKEEEPLLPSSPTCKSVGLFEKKINTKLLRRSADAGDFVLNTNC